MMSIKKKLLYRSCHRGMKEADIIIGGFANRYLDELSKQELDIFAQLLDEKDVDIMDWVFEKASVPDYIPGSFIKKMRENKS